MGAAPQGIGGPVKCPHQKTAVSVSVPLVFSPPIAHKHKDVIFLFSILVIFAVLEGLTIMFGFLEK